MCCRIPRPEKGHDQDISCSLAYLAYVSDDPVDWVDPWGLWSEYGEITNPLGFVEGIGDAIRTDIYDIVNDPHPNARADAVLKYVSATVGAGVGTAAFTKWEIANPGNYLALMDFIQSSFPGVPAISEAGAYGQRLIIFGIEAWMHVRIANNLSD